MAKLLRSEDLFRDPWVVASVDVPLLRTHGGDIPIRELHRLRAAFPETEFHEGAFDAVVEALALAKRIMDLSAVNLRGQADVRLSQLSDEALREALGAA